MKSSEGDRQKEGGKKKLYLNQTGDLSVKSCQPREMGLMRHRFNSTLQVTGLPDAIPLAPPLTSPNNTHTHTHTHTEAHTVTKPMQTTRAS